jgi:hypothetical protein
MHKNVWNYSLFFAKNENDTYLTVVIPELLMIGNKVLATNRLCDRHNHKLIELSD